MATDGSSGSKPSSSTADSYIGSLISLTSKSEIRYEGVLYNINTEESSIGLINGAVRSFGTEGRKKDGPQVPPSDKVYEYILFRGSDIKVLYTQIAYLWLYFPLTPKPHFLLCFVFQDLQVKSSPPVQPTPPINNDPAIIQSHYPRPSTSLPSTVSGPLTDPRSWGASPPPPTANGAGLAMPMYWQGYYGPPNGLPHLHQQSLLRPPPGLSMPPSMQQSMQYPNFNAPLPTGASNFPGASNMPGSNMPEASYPLLPKHYLVQCPNKGRSSTLPASTFNASLPSLPPLTTSGLEINAIVQSTSDKPNAISVPVFPYQSSSQSMPSIVGSSTSILMEIPAPSLVTPGQLLQSGPTAVPPSQTTSSSQSAQTAHKDVQVVQVSSSSEPSVPVVTEAQPPILPLPVPPRGVQKPNGAPFQSRHGYRGRERGRGTGSSRPVTKFTEDFDFMAMNEKFKKDEVWGHLGKGNKSHSKDNKEGDGKISDEDDFEDEQDAGAHKAVYNKDDFFDSISSNARDYESQNGRTRFSEQMKIDTEVFVSLLLVNFSRYRGGRGGRGPGHGGRSRGSYYGRGYGYMGRGRGRAMPNRAS
ncbi:hypothetical protein Patl1_16526 [Pistacia atlantica]|uniref:Uncharacterized protein n=1 Tax=Pistacia atlantica TaxID=434234 RepID=A0ACC1B840_9ROSI|nr:hypothetical protein Patl1_16526 [Pistacia atlantica]